MIVLVEFEQIRVVFFLSFPLRWCWINSFTYMALLHNPLNIFLTFTRSSHPNVKFDQHLSAECDTDYATDL